MSLSFILLVTLALGLSANGGEMCSPRTLPLQSFPVGHSVFAGRVVGPAPPQPGIHRWTAEVDPEALAHGVVIEVTSSVSGPSAGDRVEVYPLRHAADCAPLPADSSALAKQYPIGAAVLVDGRPPEILPRSRSRVETLWPEGRIVENPEGYDPLIAEPLDYALRLETGESEAVTADAMWYEVLKDLRRLQRTPVFEPGVGLLPGRPEAVPVLARLAYAPGYFGCLACYGRLVFSHISDAEVGTELIAHHEAIREAYPSLYALEAEQYRRYPYP